MFDIKTMDNYYLSLKDASNLLGLNKNYFYHFFKKKNIKKIKINNEIFFERSEIEKLVLERKNFNKDKRIYKKCITQYKKNAFFKYVNSIDGKIYYNDLSKLNDNLEEYKLFINFDKESVEGKRYE